MPEVLAVLVPWLAVGLVLVVVQGLGRLALGAGTQHSYTWPGWGLAVLLLTCVSTLGPLPLTPLLLGCVGLACFGFARAPGMGQGFAYFGYTLLAALPLLWVWAHGAVFMWDDFAHRLPSVQFLQQFDTLPNPQLPPSNSNTPTYPYALTWVALGVNRLLGGYFALGSALFNGALLLVFSAQLFQALRLPVTFINAALTLLLVTLFNPVFDTKVLFSGYSDVPLGLAMAIAWLHLRPSWQAGLNTQAALALGLVLALVVSLKQVGLVLAALLCIPAIMWQWYHHQRRPWRNWLVVGGLPLLAWLAWRYYETQYIGGKVFSFAPLAQWHWHLWPAMLASLGQEFIEKPHIYIPLLVLTWVALRAWRPNCRWLPLRAELTSAALLSWGYIGFLGVTYLGCFTAYEASLLASFPRYLLHVNWVVWVALVVWVAALKLECWARLRQRGFFKILSLCVLLPLVIPHKIAPPASDEANQTLALGAALPNYLAPFQGHEIWLEDPAGSGFKTHVLQYAVGYQYKVHEGPTLYNPTRTMPTGMAGVIRVTPQGVYWQNCRENRCHPPQPIPLPTQRP